MAGWKLFQSLKSTDSEDKDNQVIQKSYRTQNPGLQHTSFHTWSLKPVRGVDCGMDIAAQVVRVLDELQDPVVVQCNIVDY